MAEAGHDWSLQVRDLVKVFKEVRANDGISLTVEPVHLAGLHGEVFQYRYEIYPLAGVRRSAHLHRDGAQSGSGACSQRVVNGFHDTFGGREIRLT